MQSPAVATARKNAALAIRRAAASYWTRLCGTDRGISVCLGISGAVHLAVLLVIGSALYSSGEDDRNLPELSVQLVTRQGPSSEENTDAALPRPAPDPVKDVIEDPGTGAKTLDAPALADVLPARQLTPEAQVAAEDNAAPAPATPIAGPVLTTSGESGSSVAAVTEPQSVAPEPVPKTEQEMLTRNVQHLAQQMLDTNLNNTQLTWQQDGQQYSARVMRQPAADSTGLEQVTADITTNKDGKRLKTHLSLKRLAFSHFTQLINHWNPDIQLHDDVIDGRFHSNTEIGISLFGGIEPRFTGKVTTAAATMTREGFISRRKNQEVFQGGIETRTDRVNLPHDMPDVINGGDQEDRHVFDEDTRIIFNSDGSFVWRLANGDGPLERIESSDKPRYLIGNKGAKLYVRGTVAGIFTVYSPGDIEIEDDITYSKDPRETLLSRDFLALIAGRDIRVAKTQITGVGDLHIQAAMFAHRRFIIESTQRGKVGTLIILGSVTAGTIEESEPRYATKLDYDKRFEYLRPASFPMTRRYEVDSWDQDWEEIAGKDANAAAPSPGQSRSE